MRPARRQLDMAGHGQPFEARIPVDLQDALELRQVRRRTLRAPVGAIEVHSRRRLGPTRWPVVASIDPQAPGLGASAARIEHRDRRIIGEQGPGAEHVRGDPGLQGLQPPDRTTYPVRERRTIEFDAMPGKDLALSVQGQVVAILGDEDVREKPWCGQTLGDRALRSRRLVNRSARATAVARSTDADDAQPRRDMIEHLADRLADHVQGAATAWACPVLDIDQLVLTGQMRRQARPVDVQPATGRLLRGWKLRLGARKIGFEVFKAELQLIVIQPLGAPATFDGSQTSPTSGRLRDGSTSRPWWTCSHA